MEPKNIQFPIDDFEKLIINIGWDSLDEWLTFWDIDNNKILKNEILEYFNEDWIWGLALPLLSDAFKLKNSHKEKILIGISALPGTGKTTLGNWLERVSPLLGFNVSVISLDDFYLPALEMDKAIEGNPWNVPRGFPGSHSIDLLTEALTNWKSTGNLKSPVFDKSLRNGLGDRSYWKAASPDILIIEGWFLGVEPLDTEEITVEDIDPPLNSNEILYRRKIQNNLEMYKKSWDLIDRLWHLKPLKFSSTNSWKSQQENSMFINKGKALQNRQLDNFLRMINSSLPHESFEDIPSDVLLIMNHERKLQWVGLSNKKNN